MIKNLLGIAPTPAEDGSFSPSRFSLKFATSPVTDYDGTVYPNPYKEGKLKILMVCTEERYMVMANGKKFSTGNHPVEMMLPMLHLRNAGFDIDIFTPTGKSVKIEMWAMPAKDENVQTFYAAQKNNFENPKKLSDFVKNDMANNTDYMGIFIPGGHGAMLGLPDNQDVCKLLHWAFGKNLFILTICHGPAALLAANLNNDNKDFIFKGYKITGFPDSVDKQTPMIGYMPGHMPWKYGERLNALGVEIINNKADKSCHRDRRLLSGASPKAANDFGRLCATELLKEINKTSNP